MERSGTLKESYSLAVGDAEASRDLSVWLEGERRAEWSLTRKADGSADQMGAAELVQVVVASGGLGALLRSLNLWIKHRQSHVIVRVKADDGREVEVDATNAGNIDKIMRVLQNGG